MSMITVQATFENGILRPLSPLPLKEHQQVQIVINTRTNVVDETAGMIPWRGTPGELDRLAMDPAFLPEEP